MKTIISALRFMGILIVYPLVCLAEWFFRGVAKLIGGDKYYRWENTEN